MNSMLLFASVSFGAMTYLVVRLTGNGRGTLTGPGVAWRSIVAGALTPLAMIIVSAPSGAFRGEDQLGIQRAILSAELAVVWIAYSTCSRTPGARTAEKWSPGWSRRCSYGPTRRST